MRSPSPRLHPLRLALCLPLLVAVGCDSGSSEPPEQTPPAQNRAPLASAERTDDAALGGPGGEVRLDATASTDPDGDALQYAWTLDTPAGSSAQLSGASSARPTFVPDVLGAYTARLTVSDGEADDTADVAVIVQECTEEIGGRVDADLSLPNRCADPQRPDYRVTSNLRLSDAASLTIAAGVRMAFVSGGYIQVGRGTNNTSGLFALGTAEEPIVLTADSPSPVPGFWSAVTFWGDTRPDSRLEHVRMEYCGGEPNGDAGQIDGCLWMSNAAVVVRDVEVDRSARFGVDLVQSNGFSVGGFGPGSERLSVRNSAWNPIYVAPGYVGSIPQGGTFAGNGREPVLVSVGRVGVSQTWPDLGVPYEVTDAVDVGGASLATLTLPAGLELRFLSGALLRVGRSDTYQGALAVAGTAAAPVRFTSATGPTPGSWGDEGGIEFWEEGANGSYVEHAIVEYATNGLYFNYDFSPSVTSSVIRNNAGCGVLWRQPSRTTSLIPGNTIEGNGGGAECEG